MFDEHSMGWWHRNTHITHLIRPVLSQTTSLRSRAQGSAQGQSHAGQGKSKEGSPTCQGSDSSRKDCRKEVQPWCVLDIIHPRGSFVHTLCSATSTHTLHSLCASTPMHTNADMVAAETSTPVSTPVGKENSGRKMKALESPVSTLSDTSVELSQAASPVVWHQKVKEKKSDRSDDPELQKVKAGWLQKMNAEFAEVDEHALSEEPVSDSERR